VDGDWGGTTKEVFTRKAAEKAEAARAREEYEAGQRAMQEKTARLRALRLARDAENGNVGNTKLK
jgi:hypothetical protein